MFRRTILASAALALTLAPITAQAAPQRAPAPVEEADQLEGTTLWIVAVIGIGLLIWGIIELTGDDEPDSP